MYNKFGISLYLSSYDTKRDISERFQGSEYYVFTSFHIQEELNSISDYLKKAKVMCKSLNEKGFKIIADVSLKTLHFFAYDNVIQFAKDMHIDVLRLDYGFSDEEIISIAKVYHIAFNASTINYELVEQLIKNGCKVFAFHNYYPRPETGLDDKMFNNINQKLRKMGVKILAFIPGDEIKRGPIFEGLPTLEKHRFLHPYIAFLDLLSNFKIDSVFVGDIKISDIQFELIENYLTDGVIQIPAHLHKAYQYLYNQIFTIRVDSPDKIMRLQESRESSSDGQVEDQFNCVKRDAGSITMDNRYYKRYSGELQIVREALPQDQRVNVIGSILPDYLELMHCIKNGDKIKIVTI